MESKRLSSEGERLSENATHLDSLWLDAEQRWNLAKYPGYNRSQMHMRFNTVRLDNEANLLREEAQSLDEEAIRLWKLSGEVDPAAMKAILDRLRNCCNTKIGLQLLRVHIIRMAQTEHIRYVPR
jgi:hypothetical protein